ncbi:MAG: acyltransferase [Acinetobacter baumannii]|uniref:acyltransferase family protein n=2 Tax=Acinetobacter calcoaceticus/baumannii complex TaxID=909768 RepID=UPI0026F09249|nr:acyltransferase [Acinetobacter nosocomialis]MDO7229805.1 acyltransferase [Acinetobacter nosocomialis]MDU7562790.1 acyltransferase [Acinetobacter baumannii]
MILSKKVIGLDLLRFCMALVMVLYHIQSLLKDSILNLLSFNGFFGTSTFFILSGFILTHVYFKKIKDNKFSNSTFLIKRFSALYPIHIMTMCLSLFTFFLLQLIARRGFPIEQAYQTIPGNDSSAGTFEFFFSYLLQYIIESLSLVQAWDYRFLFLNIAAWSISALFFFYLTFHFFVKRIQDYKHLKTLLICCWISSMFPALYFTITQNFSSDVVGIIHRNPLLRLPDFIAGIIFYFICLKANSTTKKFQLLFFLIGILGFILMNILVKMNPKQWFYLSHNGLFLFTQLALIYSFLQINFKNQNLCLMIQKLGKASLSIYMLHLPLISIYFIIYKLIIATINSSNFHELMINAKKIDHLSTISVFIFLILLVPLSIYLQEKIFTPIQIKLSNSLIRHKEKFKERILG